MGQRSDRNDLDSIVDVAVGLFLDRGYDATSMTDIATASGIRKPSLYHHVASKEDLLKHGIRRALDAYNLMLTEPQATADNDPIARLTYVLNRTAITIAAYIPETALLIRTRGNTTTERWAMRERRRLNTILAEIIGQARNATSTTSPTDPAITARLVFGAATSIVDWYRPHQGALDAPHLARIIEQLLLPGLLATTGPDELTPPTPSQRPIRPRRATTDTSTT